MNEEENKQHILKLEQLLKEKLVNLNELALIGKNSNYIKELSDISLIQLELALFSDAEQNLLICLKHFEKQKDRLGIAAVYGILGTLFFKKEEFLTSLDYYERAYIIYKELMQIQEQITSLKGIGTNLIKLNKLDEACDKFIECGSVCSDNNDIYNLLDCLGNLIIIHEIQEKWDTVIELYKKSLKAFKELRDFKGMCTSYFNLGILQKKRNNVEEALRYFKKGTNVAIEANYAELIIKGLGYVGEAYFYLGKDRDAKNQFIKALHIANEIKAENAKIQLKILLQSLGLNEAQIIDELRRYKEKKK
jgi:tetratricopeptide (TPR) repeat protein